MIVEIGSPKAPAPRADLVPTSTTKTKRGNAKVVDRLLQEAPKSHTVDPPALARSYEAAHPHDLVVRHEVPHLQAKRMPVLVVTT